MGFGDDYYLINFFFVAFQNIKSYIWTDLTTISVNLRQDGDG